jgi:hypothetical protein
MQKNLLSSAFSAFLLYGLLASSAHAGGFVLYGAFTSGGDTLATAVDEDGDDVDLKAGGLIHLAAGYENRGETGGMRITYGYKFDTLDADNGDAEITRYPLEVVAYKTFSERHNLGGGLVYEMSPEFEMDVSGFGGSIEFDDATGFMLYYGYSLGNSFEWGLRYTDIEYEYQDSFFSFTVDASNFGLYASTYFE